MYLAKELTITDMLVFFNVILITGPNPFNCHGEGNLKSIGCKLIISVFHIF